MYRNSDSYTHRTGGQWSSTSWQTYAKQDTQYKNALKGISENLKANPLQDGEQLNLVGYSYGAVLQAHLAIGLTELGHKVDNLVLIGSPTSDDSPLMKTLQGLVEDGKIGKIIRHDIEGDLLSNPKSQIEFLKGGIQSAPIIGDGDNAPHFDLARPGSEADKKIESVGQKLKNNGVE
nr:alpha/beta hydrolase [Dysgonomonas sp. ZJ709]